MNHRDVWFVGLLALAYLYLDAAAPAEPRVSYARRPAPPRGRSRPALPTKPQPTHVDGCPRDLSHPVSLRSDGAKWCLACDEAFYPALN